MFFVSNLGKGEQNEPSGELAELINTQHGNFDSFKDAFTKIVGQRMREEQANHTGNEDYNYFLSVLFPADQLMIIDYNRVIKNLLPDISTDEFLTALLSNFTVIPEDGQVRPSVPGEFGLYIDILMIKNPQRICYFVLIFVLFLLNASLLFFV